MYRRSHGSGDGGDNRARERWPSLVRTDAGLSILTWQTRYCVAFAATVVALTSCVGAGGTDPTAEPEVSQPIEPPRAASSISTVERDGDAAAAALTRSLFADIDRNEPAARSRSVATVRSCSPRRMVRRASIRSSR